MTIVQVEDTRNSEWRKSNLGSKMLEKMGWTEGKGIGKRNVNTTALRAVKRQEGLGIGAKRQTEGGPSESTGTFAAVLANLKAHHGNENEKKSKNKSKKEKKEVKKKAQRTKKALSLPQNKVLAGHARKMRAAKFGAKSAEDLACIFGNTEVVSTATMGAAPYTAIPAVGATSSSVSNKKKRSRKDESKKSKDSCGENNGGGSSEEDQAKVSQDISVHSDSDKGCDIDPGSKVELSEKQRKRAEKKRKKEDKENKKESSSESDENKTKKEKKSKKSKKKSKKDI
mmetsp:Transcript_2741/g.6549  ORF Transcript_2741/g.6549 Transcript_2741/m.6549 type:complete len:284 (+) Transcript_2741:166-1017(+)